jgi:hypothetical protein
MNKQNKSSDYVYVRYSVSGGTAQHKITTTFIGKDADEWATEKEALISVGSKGENQGKVQVWEFREIPNWLGRIVKGY